MSDGGGPDDRERLWALVETWRAAVDDVVALLRSLDEGDWARPTDLPGWDVRAVAAHLAHLESELAGNPQPEVEDPAALQAEHVRGPMGEFTERGPAARAGWSTAAIVDELATSAATRYAALRDDPPLDGSALGPGFAAFIGWTWSTLLSNRPLDVWMHEQDVRRAVGRPGGLDSAAASHVTGVFARSLPYVLGKRAGARPGQSVRVVVTGPQPLDVVVVVGEDGRGRLAGDHGEPTATVRLGTEDFVVRCGGRRSVDALAVTVEGDADLARRFLDALATTP